MKIYEIGTGYTPIPAQMGAATEIVVEDLTHSFIKSGIDAEIIDIKAQQRAATNLPITEVSVPSVFTKTDVSLGIMHKLKRVVYSISLAKKIQSILKNTNEKVILHFHNQYNLYFFLRLTPAKLRSKATIAYTVHSYIWGDKWDKIKETVNKKYFQEIYCVKNADIVFVLNDITAEHFATQIGVDKKRIYKVLNGVNIEKYKPLTDDEIMELKSSSELDGKKTIFQVGSVCERKNQLGCVEMLADYLRENRDVIYMYAGGIIDSEYQQAIENLAVQKGIFEQVKYVGELSPGATLNKYYNMADCSVFTSTLESFGLVIIEAIASGTPVIVGGKLMFDLSGGYHTYSSKEEFVALVDLILSDTKKKMCDAADVVGRYNWDSIAKAHYEIFSC